MSTNQSQWAAKALALVVVAALGLGVSTWLLSYKPRHVVSPARVEHVDRQVATVVEAQTQTLIDQTVTTPGKTLTIPASTETIEAVTERHHPSWATPLAIGLIVLVVGGSAVLLFQPRKPDQPA